MKKLSLSVLCLLLTLISQGQTYIVPHIGIGVSTFKPASIAPTTFHYAYRVGVGLEKHLSRISLHTGIAYFTSSFAYKGPFTLMDKNQQPVGTVRKNMPVEHGHIGVPLLVGFKLRSRKVVKSSLIIGVEGTYNTGIRYRSFGFGGTSMEHMDSDEFSNGYQRFAAFGVAQLRLSWELKNRLLVYVAPSARYTITNLMKSDRFKTNERHLILGVEGGVGIRMR